MTAKWSDDQWKEFLLDHWKKWFPDAQITYQTGAPEPPPDRGDFLDYLNEWAQRIEWPGSKTPTVEKAEDGFLLRRGSTRENTPRKSVYTALGTVLQETLLKPEG